MRDETYSSAQATNAGGTPDAELPRYGLERVILIDSYLRGANTEIRVDGHTAITGANSAGKTSMIRLLPAFFGAPPRSLVKAKVGSTQKSFQDYYLPSRSSYVVFEYRTQRGLNLAVFTTHSNTTQLKIVLISGGYADDLFVGADEKYLDKDDLPTRARAAGRFVKVCTTVKGYRQFVLGDSKVRGRTTEEIGFNILAGYPNSTRRSLDGVHAVLTATLDEDIDERLLRRLLFEQAAQETNWSADAELRFNADELEEWVGNYRGLKSMLTQTERACEAIDAGQTLKYLGVREAVLHAALERAQQAVVETLNEARDYEQSNQNLLESKAAAYRQARRDHDTEHDKASGKLRDIRSEKDSLRRRERGLLGEGAEAASVVAAELSERQTALGQEHRQLDELARQSEEIDRPIDSAIERTETEARKALEEVQRERENVARDHDVLGASGVRVGGLDMDIKLAMRCIMPLFGLGSNFTDGLPIPLTVFWNAIAINDVNAQAAFFSDRGTSEVSAVLTRAAERHKLERLVRLHTNRLSYHVNRTAEWAKISLSTHNQTEMALDYVEPLLSTSATRTDLRNAVSLELKKLKSTMEEAVAQAQTQPSVVFITGGSARSPLIRDAIRSEFQDTEIVAGDAFGSVASGLAVKAHQLFG